MSSWFGRFRRQQPQSPPPVQPSTTGATQTAPGRPPFRPAGAALSPSRKPPSRAASRPSTPPRNGKRTPPVSPSRLAVPGETSPPPPPPQPQPPRVENVPPQQPSNERTPEEEPVPMKEREAAPDIPTPHAGDTIDESKLQLPEMSKQSSETSLPKQSSETLPDLTKQPSETFPEPTKQSPEIFQEPDKRPSETILPEPAKQSLETTLLEPTQPSSSSSETTFIEPPPPQISDPLLMGNNKKEEPQPTAIKPSEPEEEQEAAGKQQTTNDSGEKQTIKTVVAETSKDKDDHSRPHGEFLAQNRAAGVKAAAEINVIITLTGENRGAVMQLGRPSNEKPIHIHRAYKPSQRAVDHPTKEEDMEAAANASYVNSNVQGVNNSILMDSHVREMDPGVSVGIPRFPAEEHAKQNDQTPLLPRDDAEESRDGKRRIRRRCLRGLLMEPSDSDSDNNNPEKPRRRRRHGCPFPC